MYRTSRQFRLALVASCLPLLALACSGSDEPKAELPKPTATETKDPVTNVQVVEKPAEKPDAVTGSPTAVATKISLAKSAIFGRSFLYGADLQYSSLNADQGSPVMAIAVGHWISTFRVLGDELQLVGETKQDYESDVNHPEQLLARWKIAFETDSEITVYVERPSVALESVTGEQTNAAGMKGWLRSVQYESAAKLLLIESTVQQADGTLWQFMESIFPRETLVKDDFKPFDTNPATNPYDGRFGYFTAGPVWVTGPTGRVRTEFANRYDVRQDTTLDWYVTPNVPDDQLANVKNGIEGWNRYFRAMFGRDVIAFKGKLPNGVKIGDPRYNVLNWDGNASYGTARASFASDPLTGAQSHGIVYMPYAWVTIGLSYWTVGQYSEELEAAEHMLEKAVKGRTIAGRPLEITCSRRLTDAITLTARDNPKDFATEVVKGTILHEVGHVLGLRHNFRGSLSFTDGKDPGKFSSSIMDYNHYDAERGLFEGPASANGPLLEYDRQALDALYNGGKGIKDTDEVVPFCTDDLADVPVGGVDPVCIRYDLGRDPAKFTLDAIALLQNENATVGARVSLPKALENVRETLPDPATVTDGKTLNTAISGYLRRVQLTMRYYLDFGSSALASMTEIVSKGLYDFQPGVSVLPDGKENVSDSADPEAELVGREARYRADVFQALTFAASFTQLPPASQKAYQASLDALLDWAVKTAYVAPAPDAAKAQLVAAINNGPIASQQFTLFESANPNSTVSRVRRFSLSSLKRVEGTPFHFGKDPLTNRSVDYEAEVINILDTCVRLPVGKTPRSLLERNECAANLVTFAGVTNGALALDRARKAVEVELAAAQDSQTREGLRLLQKTLYGG